MRKIIYVSLTAVVLAAAPARVDQAREPAEISRLDECIQRRFLGMNVFGMRRILPMQYHGVQTFRPENAVEREVVDQLEKKGYAVAFYLAGRAVLGGPREERRFRIQGPAYITAGDRQFPPPDTLLADARGALASFQKGSSFDAQQGKWTVAMRPLRASNAACIQCHTTGGGSIGVTGPLAIGDPLGVAIYVYRR